MQTGIERQYKQAGWKSRPEKELKRISEQRLTILDRRNYTAGNTLPLASPKPIRKLSFCAKPLIITVSPSSKYLR